MVGVALGVEVAVGVAVGVPVTDGLEVGVGETVAVGAGELLVKTDGVGEGVVAIAEDCEKILKMGNNPSTNDVAVIRVLFQKGTMGLGTLQA
jgi:hypothetical protein